MSEVEQPDALPTLSVAGTQLFGHALRTKRNMAAKHFYKLE